MLKAQIPKNIEAVTNLLSPIRMSGIKLCGAYDVLSDSGEKVALAAEVIVKRHRSHTHRLSEGSHRQSVGPPFVYKLDGNRNELIARETFAL